MPSSIPHFIIQAEQALAKAHITMELDIIDSLLHADYVIVQSGGKIETKAEVLDSYKTGSRHWDTAEVDDLDVKVYGDMARVMGLWKASGSNHGMPFNYQAHFVSIWIKEHDRWQNISYASAEIENRGKA